MVPLLLLAVFSRLRHAEATPTGRGHLPNLRIVTLPSVPWEQ